MLQRREITFLGMHGGVGKFRVLCVGGEEGTKIRDLDQVGSMVYIPESPRNGFMGLQS